MILAMNQRMPATVLTYKQIQICYYENDMAGVKQDF